MHAGIVMKCLLLATLSFAHHSYMQGVYRSWNVMVFKLYKFSRSGKSRN